MNQVPEPVARIAEVMSTYRAPWCLCGGWAVDAWLGQVTRDHGDVDIAIFQDGLPVLFEHLGGWQLIAHDPAWTPDMGNEPWDGSSLVLPAHFHARPPEASGPIPQGILTPEQGFWLDIQVNERSDDDWILNEDPRLTMALHRSVQQSHWGAPTAVPEVLFYYKAGELQRVAGLGRVHPNADLDFNALLQHLNNEQRVWLREALSLVHSGHPWLAQLAS